MMTLLEDKPVKDIQEHLPSPSKVAPLVVHFSSGCVPNGCFSNTVSCLISTYNWEVCRTREGKPECLAHNIVTLSDPTLPVTITMVNYTRHLEIHVSMAKIKKEDFSNICLKIHVKVFAAIEKVFKVMRFEDIRVKPAFLCPCKCSPTSHAAIICHLPTSSYIVCSNTSKQVRSLKKKEQFWFQDEKKGKTLHHFSDLLCCVILSFLSLLPRLFSHSATANSYSTTATSFQDQIWQHARTDWNTL